MPKTSTPAVNKRPCSAASIVACSALLALLVVGLSCLPAVWAQAPAPAVPAPAVAAAPAPAAPAVAAAVAPLVPPVKKPVEAVQTCVQQGCHTDVVSHRVMHGPVAEEKCFSCHKYKDAAAHTFELTTAADKLCIGCHNMRFRDTVHQPVKEGNCVGCHSPHGSEHRFNLVADPAGGLCEKCHDSMLKKKFVHGPVAKGACILCHQPHSSWLPKLLEKPATSLCLNCHTELIPPASDNQHVHAPVKDGQCTTCHDSHASDNRHQLKEATPGLCFNCHKDSQKKMAEASIVHGALTQPDGCMGCHVAHFSQFPKLQKNSQVKACLTCHNESITTSSGKKLVNMGKLLAENPEQHGPIREDNCIACHQPHTGERFRRLVQEYPPEFYAAFDIARYGLCFSCHIPQLVLSEVGTGLTRFRNGSLNLHFLHVNQEKGRTCRACHEVHASKHPFHIRDAVPFGSEGWMLEVGYKKTDTGGSCASGCHKLRSYDYARPVVNDNAPRSTAVAPAAGLKTQNQAAAGAGATTAPAAAAGNGPEGVTK